ncbi:TPA: SymE family type I addiction module toxin [Raoultella planticola]|uniref:SymE family type I addiction module toxin n=1 Tax=Raoultella planticola TaxID=575 RepID=UPI0027B8AC9F|nr:SymE family type I addiction module toxin [Raoultella planticola]
MAEQNFKPENAIAKIDSDESETSGKNCELLRKKSVKHLQNKSTAESPQPLSRTEFYDRMWHDYIPLQGDWLSQAGFTPGMPIKIRVMPDCVVITAPEQPGAVRLCRRVKRGSFQQEENGLVDQDVPRCA